MRSLPLFHRIAGRPVIVLGQGEAAETKRRLVERAGGIVVEDDDRDARLAFVALDNPELAVTRLKARGVLVNVVDRPDFCDFTVPSVLDRDPVLVAVGTDGASAGLAKHLRLRQAEAQRGCRSAPLDRIDQDHPVRRQRDLAGALLRRRRRSGGFIGSGRRTLVRGRCLLACRQCENREGERQYRAGFHTTPNAQPFLRCRRPSSSAICTAFSAAPLRRLSDTHHSVMPFSTVGSSRTRLM